MADSANTTIPTQISFSSAGAVRARARHATPLPPTQLAHNALIAALAAETPHQIIGHFADRFDLMERRDHLKTVLSAVVLYAKTVVAESAEFAPCGYVKDETGYLVDAAAEIEAAFDNAVDRMIDDAAVAAE
jgi:hypothetical protein